MNDLGYRNIWISFRIAMAFAVVGMLLFRHVEAARGVVGLLSVVLAVLVLHVLDDREMRKREER